MSNRIDLLKAVDPLLTQVAVGYGNGAFVGTQLMPRVFVEKMSGKMYSFGKGHMKNYSNIKRANGAPPAQIGWEAPTTIDYACQEKAIEETYDVNESAAANFNLASHLTKTGMDVINLGLEIDIATIATTAASYATADKTALTGSTCWSHADSDPIANIDAGLEQIRTNTGIKGNTIVLSTDAFKLAKNHADIIDRVKYTNSGGIVTTTLLSQIFSEPDNIVNVYVAPSVYDNAGTMTKVWGDNVVIAHVPSNPASFYTPAYGYTLTMNGFPQVLTYNAHNSGLIQGITVRHYYDTQVTMQTAAHLISNTQA